MRPALVLLVLTFVVCCATSCLANKAAGRYNVLPRVFYYADCGCSGASQEASNVLLGLAEYDIGGRPRSALQAAGKYEDDDDDTDKFVAFWLSAAACPARERGRCGLAQPKQRGLLKDLEKNAKLNHFDLVDFRLPGGDSQQQQQQQQLDTGSVEKMVRHLAGKDDGDVEYAARVLQYIEDLRPVSVIVSHHADDLICPVAEHFYLTSPRHSVGAAIFGSWWPNLLASVDSLLRPFLPYDSDDDIVHVCRVSYPTGQLPAYEVQMCNANCDVIVLPTDWHRGVFAASGVKESLLRVIPTAVDLDFFAAQQRSSSSSSRGHVFVAVVALTVQKNWKSLLNAYYTAFSRDDDVEFVVKVEASKRGFNPKYTLSMFSFGWAKEHDADVEDLPKVTLITKSYDQKRMRSLYASAHTFVSASHGDSLCLTLAEAMAMGLSSIVPDWGPFREYVAHGDTGLLVDVVGTTPSGPQYGATPWADVSTESLANHMRWMADHPAEAAAMGLRARQRLEQRQSLDAVAAQWIALFNSTAPAVLHADEKLKKSKEKGKDKEEKGKDKEDKVKEEKVKEDKVKEDKVKEDKVKEDKVKEDKVKEEKVKDRTKKELRDKKQ